MITAAYWATVASYLIATTLYLVLLARGGRLLERWSAFSLALAVAVHAAFLACDYQVIGQAPVANIRQTLAGFSLLIPLGYLISMRRSRLPVLGAFITPVALLFFLGSGVHSRVTRVPVSIHSIILPIHVGASMLGVVAFSFAFGASLGYLIQERLLRAKRVIGLFQRLPALDVLDSLGHRLVIIGFIFYTLGVVTGSLYALRLAPDFSLFSAAQWFAWLAWLFFAAVLALRRTAGWSGRRAAIGTVLGFLCAVVTLVGYLIRDL